MKTSRLISATVGVTSLFVCGWHECGSRALSLGSPRLMLFRDSVDHAQPRPKLGPPPPAAACSREAPSRAVSSESILTRDSNLALYSLTPENDCIQAEYLLDRARQKGDLRLLWKNFAVPAIGSVALKNGRWPTGYIDPVRTD